MGVLLSPRVVPRAWCFRCARDVAILPNGSCPRCWVTDTPWLDLLDADGEALPAPERVVAVVTCEDCCTLLAAWEGSRCRACQEAIT